MSRAAGFSLLELMVSVAIIAVLAVISVPAFMTYRDRSMITQVVGSSEAIRAAFASYAAGSSDNNYPPSVAITNFATRRTVVNDHVAALPTAAVFTVQHYDFYDSDGDSVADAYSMRLLVNGVKTTLPGAQILITPQGILKCTLSGAPC